MPRQILCGPQGKKTPTTYKFRRMLDFCCRASHEFRTNSTETCCRTADTERKIGVRGTGSPPCDTHLKPVNRYMMLYNSKKPRGITMRSAKASVSQGVSVRALRPPSVARRFVSVLAGPP